MADSHVPPQIRGDAPVPAPERKHEPNRKATEEAERKVLSFIDAFGESPPGPPVFAVSERKVTVGGPAAQGNLPHTTITVSRIDYQIGKTYALDKTFTTEVLEAMTRGDRHSNPLAVEIEHLDRRLIAQITEDRKVHGLVAADPAHVGPGPIAMPEIVYDASEAEWSQLGAITFSDAQIQANLAVTAKAEESLFINPIFDHTAMLYEITPTDGGIFKLDLTPTKKTLWQRIKDRFR